MADAAKEAAKPAWLAEHQSSASHRGSFLPAAAGRGDAAADLMASLSSALSGSGGDAAKRAPAGSIAAGGSGAAPRPSRTDAAAGLLADLDTTLSGAEAAAPKRTATSSIGAGSFAAPRSGRADVAADLLADLDSALSGAAEGPRGAPSASIFAPASESKTLSTARRPSQAHAPGTGARRLSQTRTLAAAAASPRMSMLMPEGIRASVSTGGSELAAIDAVLQGAPKGARRAADAQQHGSVSSAGGTELAQIEAMMRQDRRVSSMPKAAAAVTSMRRMSEVLQGAAGGVELAQIDAIMRQDRRASALPEAIAQTAHGAAEAEPNSRRGTRLAAADVQRAASIGGAELAAISAVLQHETERRVSAALQPGTRQASPRSTGSIGAGELAQIKVMLQQERKAAPAAAAQKSARVTAEPATTPARPNGLEGLLAEAAEAASGGRQSSSPARQQSIAVPTQKPDVHLSQRPSAVDPSKSPGPASALQSRHPSISKQPAAFHAPALRSRQTQFAHMLQPDFVIPPSLARMQAKLRQEPQLPPDLIITAQLGYACDRMIANDITIAVLWRQRNHHCTCMCGKRASWDLYAGSEP